MSRYTIRPEAFVPPSSFSPYLRVSFRLPFESRDPIFPASGLQLSFADPTSASEIFTERIAARDVQRTDAGLCTVRLGGGEVPRYALRRGATAGADAGEVLVRLHAWKGERHLGAWEVGRLRGEQAYRIVD